MTQLRNENEAAALLALSVRTLQTWRQRGVGPRFTKLRGAVRYRQGDLEAFISAGERTSTRSGSVSETSHLRVGRTATAPVKGGKRAGSNRASTERA